jgi:3-oxoacyl-[acyl-carrier protein] reductase
VTKRADWEAALAATEKAFGGVNFIINNAGATYKSKPVLETTEKDFDLCFDVNLKSIFHSVHVMIPALRRTREAGGPAAFVNVASTAGIMGRPGLTW